MVGRHPTSSHREKSSDVSPRSSSGEEGCLGNWAGFISSWNLCGHGRRQNQSIRAVIIGKLKWIISAYSIRFGTENSTSAFLFLLIILSSVCFMSWIKEWFRCSSQMFLRRTSQKSRRTTAAGNTQHCRENTDGQTIKQSDQLTTELVLNTCDKLPQQLPLLNSEINDSTSKYPPPPPYIYKTCTVAHIVQTTIWLGEKLTGSVSQSMLFL